jgi:hypothetical protein
MFIFAKLTVSQLASKLFIFNVNIYVVLDDWLTVFWHRHCLQVTVLCTC